MSKEDNTAAQEHLAQFINTGNIDDAVKCFAKSGLAKLPDKLGT